MLRKPHPLYAEKGAGCTVTDVEGVTRIDFANNVASLIHGHALPAVVEAVSTQLQKGTAFTLATEVEIEFAEHMCSRNAGFENIRFVNSGTEAVMGCLKAARAYTGRPKIAKVETSQGSFPGKLGGDIENFLSGLTNSLTSATQDKDIEQQPVKQPNGGGGGPPEPEREDKFTFAQKIESTKAGIAGLVTGASVLLPFTAVSTLVSDSSNKGAQFGLDTAIGGFSS